MRWKKISDYAIESECGNWRISKSMTGKFSAFTVWKKREGNFSLEATYKDADKAKNHAKAKAGV